MDDPDANQEYSEVVNTLLTMFGNVMSKDVIFAVVENCGGDLNLSAEAIMNINESSPSQVIYTDSTVTENITSPLVSDVTTHSMMNLSNSAVITDGNERATNMEGNGTNNPRDTNVLNTPLKFLTLTEMTTNTIPVSNYTPEDMNVFSLERNNPTNTAMQNIVQTYSSTSTSIINTNTMSMTNIQNPELTNAKISDDFVSGKPLVSHITTTETLMPISNTIGSFKSPESVFVPKTMDVTSPFISPQVPSNVISNPFTTSISLSNSFKEFIPSNIGTIASQNNQPDLSYANMSRNTGALPKQNQIKKEPKINWTPQLGRIIKAHNRGHRILILMRGLPGSGKSFLARQVIELTVGSDPVNYKIHIFSTDDYFSRGGTYEFDKRYLSLAHEWNQNRVKQELEKGYSPIIVDNTNIENWEMEPYLRQGVKNGYIIDIMQPKTPWAKKPNQLLRKNQHGVSITTITKMLSNFRDNITFEYLMNFYRLSYPPHMNPPVMRNNRPVDTSKQSPQSATSTDGIENKKDDTPLQQQFDLQSSVVLSSDIKEEKDNKLASSVSIKTLLVKEAFKNDADKDKDTVMSDDTENVKHEFNTVSTEQNLQKYFKSDTDSKDIMVSNDTENIQQESNPETEQKQSFYMDIEKQLEEMEKVEREWENGEEWDENAQEKSKNNYIEKSITNDPKPPRNDSIDSANKDKLLKSVKTCQDWRQISMFMPPWNDENISSPQKILEIPVEMKSSSTFMEIGDTDINNSRSFWKIISATPRNINEYHIAPTREKIPEKRMLDKSSMTIERLITEACRCKNEERHFIAFRKMFKSITKSALRDIFDQCCGDVNWAVEIVLDGMANNQLETVNVDEISDLEEENSEQCSCLSAYNIVPDTSIKQEIPNDIPETPADSELPRKIKKEIPVSDLSLQLKRQMEQNFVIADNHYSDHCLKIRKIRRGELDAFPNNSQQASAIEQPENAQAVALYSNSTNNQDDSTQSDSDNESSSTSFEETENIVNINIGREFVSVLDDLFGRNGMTYPESVEPKISIPVYLLNEINALWMESLMYQMDERAKQSAIMMKQDAEFARQLAQMELEFARTGKEPEVPDFKEIMDMDFAISLYQKDVAEWRNKEPTDLAARLTRDKLYNLFPDLPQDTLSELLMAHDNNFQSTVEVLLMSTGKANILQEKNGLNKFVMKKEMERQKKILEEEKKKALSEVEWPLLPRTEHVDMGVVNSYRDEADKHLVRRNANYQKAQEYIRRGMLQVATYYSGIATFHKQKFDQANSLAAASLIQVHAANNPDNSTIDLHYLRVGEAKESLDLFLDMHINKLRESKAANRGPKEYTLFFITGRGLHSNGKPKIKPAVKNRLRERGLIFSERNPGLLSAKVSAEDKLTYQVQTP